MITDIRQKIGRDTFDYQALRDALSGYSKPRDRITRLLAGGAIVRVKKGLYCFGEPFRRGPVIREHLANLIYGPSYVSLDYALGYHGLIPERVERVTSVTTGRSREFATPFGVFSFRMLSVARYAAGAVIEEAGGTPFLIATPEKALADKVWADKRFSGRRVSDYRAYLSDDLRIDEDALRGLDRSRLKLAAEAYSSPKIDNLVRCLERLEEPAHA
jgi:predicted transcriptional regulator of viral defense system